MEKTYLEILAEKEAEANKQFETPVTVTPETVTEEKKKPGKKNTSDPEVK